MTVESGPAESIAPVDPAPAPVGAAPAPVEIPTPVAADPAAAEPAPAEAPAPEPSIVEGDVKPAEAAPLEAKAPEAAALEPVAPVYADFKLPEGFAAEPEQTAAFTGILSEFGLNQEQGQKLMDLHAASLTKAVETLSQQGQDAFQNMRRDWRESFYKTAGNRADTMANDAKWTIQHLFPKTEERKAFTDVLAATGAGDNYAMISALARVATRLRERGAPASPLPAKGQSMTAADRRYSRSPTR